MIDFGITVDKDVSKGNDTFVFADPGGGRCIGPGQLRKRLSDDFQLPLYRRAQDKIRSVVGEVLAGDKLDSRSGRGCDVRKDTSSTQDA